ncbi:MAG: Flp pilus assembly complex ATPase component TadA [Verrucomicrobiales bacterium]|nr:Flp pilus assembly complex ATPase component TadA [Verrucomicrobiales bacterium]
MAVASIKRLLSQAALAGADQWDQWRREWAAEPESGAKAKTLLEQVQRRLELPEADFLPRVATALGWPYVERISVPQEEEAKRELRRRLSPKIAFQHQVSPVKIEGDHVWLAPADPFDSDMISTVLFDAGERVQFVLAPREEIDKGLKGIYGVGAETLDGMAKDDAGDEEQAVSKEITEDDQEASVIKFVNQIVWEAYNSRATDIHFEPMETDLRIRYRIDGMLYRAPVPNELKKYQSAILSRVKVMAGMNIAEKRLPQDGRINVRIKGQEIDIRVSTVPTVYGESTSLRLLRRGGQIWTMPSLGLPAREEEAIRQLIRKPHGIFLVTGPTGSGKSTSLYTFLTEINLPTKRIITVEEPVEYEIAGINQIAVRPDIGLTFAVGLRHILRQDPNVVMVGEIRDLETAEIAIRASLTGHLVFSTLHTNDAPSAFTRLIDMGIEPFLVASSVEAVMAQRLVRLICPACQTPQTVEPTYLAKIGFPRDQVASTTFYKGAGCDECRFLGYQDRTGIYELLVVNEGMRPLIMSRASASTIAARSLEDGMKTLRMAGWERVRHPTRPTTLEEVLRVTQVEEHLTALLGDEKP